MEHYKIEFDRIVELLEEADLSRKQLGYIIGMNYNSLRQYFFKKKVPKSHYAGIERFFALDSGWIVKGGKRPSVTHISPPAEPREYENPMFVEVPIVSEDLAPTYASRVANNQSLSELPICVIDKGSRTRKLIVYEMPDDSMSEIKHRPICKGSQIQCELMKEDEWSSPEIYSTRLFLLATNKGMILRHIQNVTAKYIEVRSEIDSEKSIKVDRSDVVEVFRAFKSTTSI